MGQTTSRNTKTHLKRFPNCSHAHALFQDRFKDVQVGSRWFSTLYILSPNFHTPSWPWPIGKHWEGDSAGPLSEDAPCMTPVRGTCQAEETARHCSFHISGRAGGSKICLHVKTWTASRHLRWIQRA